VAGRSPFFLLAFGALLLLTVSFLGPADSTWSLR